MLGFAVISGMQVDRKLHKDMLGTPIKPDSCLLCDMENSCFSNRTKLHPVFLSAESQIWFYVSWVMCFNIVQQMFTTCQQIIDANWMKSTDIAQDFSKLMQIGYKALILCHPCCVIFNFFCQSIKLRDCASPGRELASSRSVVWASGRRHLLSQTHKLHLANLLGTSFRSLNHDNSVEGCPFLGVNYLGLPFRIHTFVTVRVPELEIDSWLLFSESLAREIIGFNQEILSGFEHDKVIYYIHLYTMNQWIIISNDILVGRVIWIQGANALELFEAWIKFTKWDTDFANKFNDCIQYFLFVGC